MRKSKIPLLGLLVLVCLTQACVPAAQPVTPQVITVVVTAGPTVSDQTDHSGASATPAPGPTTEISTATTVPSPTSMPQVTGTLSPSPTASPQVIHANTPTRTPAPQLPMVSNLPAQGPKGGDIDFEVNMSPVYLMRIKARKHGSANDGDGMDHVLFSVNKKNGGKVYANKETSAKYCIFMGGEPDCNPWPKANGRYVWGDGGPEITSGDYQVTIRAALKSDPSNESEWTFQITIKLP